MNTTQTRNQLLRRAALRSAGALLLAGAVHASAADRTWDGGGDQFSWLNAANWGGTAPVAGDGLFFDGTTGLNNNNDLAAGTAFAGVTFKSGADAFTIAGNEINLSGGVTNLSANPQTLNLNLNQTGNRTHYAATNMTYGGQVKNNALIKRGPGTLRLTGTLENSSLRAEVYDGVLELNKTSGSTRSLPSSPIVVSDSGTLRIVAGSGSDQIHFSQRVVVTNGGIFQIQNPFEEIGSLSGSSSFTGVVENGLAGSTNRLDLGGGNGRRGIYSGMIRDGAGVLNLQVYRHDNIYAFNGAHTYSGTTAINNTSGAGTTRLILNGSHVGGGAYVINGHASTTDRKAALCGSGVISAASVEARIRGLISPGGALSADLADSATFAHTTAILTISNNVVLTNGTLDIQLSGTTAGAGYDRLVIAGSGILTVTNGDLQLALGFAPANGDKFTIVQVQGTDSASTVGQFTSLNGLAMDLSQGATFVEPISGKNFRISYRAEGTTFDAGAGNGNDIMLEAVAPVGGANLTWRGNGTDNNWDVTTTANWWNGASLVTFTNGDFVKFDDTGTNTTPVNLVGDLTPASLQVNATKDYVLGGGGKLTGTIVITKTNSGTFSLVTENDPVGSTTIQAGTLQIGTNGTSGSLTGTISVGSNGVLAHNRSDDVVAAFTFSGSGGFVHKGDGKLILTTDVPFAGHTTNTGGVLQLGDGSTLFGSLSGDINIPSGKQLTYKYPNGQKDVYNSLSGSGTVEYDGSLGGAIKIATTAVSSNFTGTANLILGTRLWCSDNNNGYVLGNGSTVNVPDFSQVWLDRSATPYNQVFNISGNGYAGDSPELGALRVFGSTLNGEINLLANARIGGTISGGTILAPVKGAFQLEVLGNTDFQLSMGPTNGTHTYASTLVTRGWVRALNSNAISAGPLTLDIAGGLRLNGNNLTVASLTDINSGLVTGSGAQVQNSHGSAAAILTVGTDNSSTTFNGVVGNGSGGELGLTKVGSGTFTVTGANTNTGPVTVNGGTLALSGSGSFGNASQLVANATLDVIGIGGTLTLNSGQTLKGGGTVNGALVAPPGTTVSPGSSVGTLTVSGNVTLGGTLLMELDRTNSPANCDQLVSSGGIISYGGVLSVTNIGPALQAGDTFQLFSSAVSGFSGFAIATTDASGSVYTWTNKVSQNGSIQVLSVAPPVNPVPTNITVSVSGGNLNLSWPADHTGWSLQAQTNVLGTGLSSNWVTIPGSTATNAVSFPIDPANPAVFFRLFYVVP
jgi:autotransporter-associated beta strand protein